MELLEFNKKTLLLIKKVPHNNKTKAMAASQATHVLLNWVGTIIIIFLLGLMCAITGPTGSSSPSGNSTNVTGRIEQGTFFVDNFDTNTITHDSDIFLDFATGYLYMGPDGTVSANAENSFLLVQGGTVVNLTRSGFYSALISLRIMLAPGNTGAQNMAYAIAWISPFPIFDTPVGWYGFPPITDAWGTLPAESGASSLLFSIRMPFFYNGTLPLALAPLLVGALRNFVPGTLYGNVSLSIALDRYNDVTGV
jgi:hypothetical protein